jgi:hypothetical protein
LSPEQELDFLKEEARRLDEMLKSVEERMKEKREEKQ